MDRGPVSTQMQRLGFPKCKHVQSGHLGTSMIHTLITEMHMTHTKIKKPSTLLCGAQKYELGRDPLGSDTVVKL